MLLRWVDLPPVRRRSTRSSPPAHPEPVRRPGRLRLQRRRRRLRESDVLERLNEGRLTEAACALELWRKADIGGDPVVLDALIRRRAAEKALFLTPPERLRPDAVAARAPRLDARAAQFLPARRPAEIAAPLEGERAEVRLVAPYEVEPELGDAHRLRARAGRPSRRDAERPPPDGRACGEPPTAGRRRRGGAGPPGRPSLTRRERAGAENAPTAWTAEPEADGRGARAEAPTAWTRARGRATLNWSRPDGRGRRREPAPSRLDRRRRGVEDAGARRRRLWPPPSPSRRRRRASARTAAAAWTRRAEPDARASSGLGVTRLGRRRAPPAGGAEPPVSPSRSRRRVRADRRTRSADAPERGAALPAAGRSAPRRPSALFQLRPDGLRRRAPMQPPRREPRRPPASRRRGLPRPPGRARPSGASAAMRPSPQPILPTGHLRAAPEAGGRAHPGGPTASRRQCATAAAPRARAADPDLAARRLGRAARRLGRPPAWRPRRTSWRRRCSTRAGTARARSAAASSTTRPPAERDAARRSSASTGPYVLLGLIGFVAFGGALFAFSRGHAPRRRGRSVVLAWILALIGAACVGISVYFLLKRLGRSGRLIRFHQQSGHAKPPA